MHLHIYRTKNRITKILPYSDIDTAVPSVGGGLASMEILISHLETFSSVR